MAEENKTAKQDNKKPLQTFKVLVGFKTDKKEYKRGDEFKHSDENVIRFFKQNKNI